MYGLSRDAISHSLRWDTRSAWQRSANPRQAGNACRPAEHFARFLFPEENLDAGIRRAGSRQADAYLRLYQAAYPHSDVDRYYAGTRAGGFDYGWEGQLFDLTGVPDERITVRVDTRGVADRTWAAILRHRTQLDEHQRIPEPLRWIVLDAECFVQAFPPRAPGGPVLDDLLAAVDGA
jgi:hypothetical protein